MTDITIYHNSRCSKSRQTMAILEEFINDNSGHKLTVVNYLQTPPTSDELKSIITLLGFTSARALMRTGEAIYKELALKEETNEAVLLQAMLENPKLIERPIVLANGKAKIGRPPESILSIL